MEGSATDSMRKRKAKGQLASFRQSSNTVFILTRLSLSAISSGVSFLSSSTDLTVIGFLRISRMTFCANGKSKGRDASVVRVDHLRGSIRGGKRRQTWLLART